MTLMLVLVSSLSSNIGPAAPPLPDLDLAFVLDVTGSMSGEIREVKERVHQIAGLLADARPGARVRIGLVVYRDRGDDFVTRSSPLSADVEVTFEFLERSVAAGGGGDGPEDVLSGLAEALFGMDWDSATTTDRQIFLIGDASPHLDYEDGPRPGDLVREALRQRIVINSIGCRSLPPDGVTFFREIAYATEGAYHHIGRIPARAPGMSEGRRKGVAEAVLQTLDRKHEADELEPIGLYFIESTAPEEVGAIEVDGLVEAGGTCGLRIGLPVGIRLAADPRAAVASDGLHVALPLAAGQGENAIYDLEHCLPAAVIVHVEAEVER
jgi:hypothetical protein